MNYGIGADANPKKHESKIGIKQQTAVSPALSMLKNKTLSNTIATRQVAFLCQDGVSHASVVKMKTALQKAGAIIKIIAPHLGTIATEEGNVLVVDQSYLIAASVLFDAVFIPAGEGIALLKENKEVIEFVNDAFKHCKIIAAEGEGITVLSSTNALNNGKSSDNGVLLSQETKSKFANSFIAAMGHHRFWEREEKI